MSQASKAETSSDRSPVTFGRYYYDHYQHDTGIPYEHNEHWQGIFDRVAETIVRLFQPRKALDAGCAVGLLVRALRERGVDAYGIDISDYAVTAAPEDLRPYLRQGSLADPIDDRFDLVTCIETVEHMPAGEAEAAIANLCAVTDRIVFSSSPDDYGEPSHLTVRPVEYWASLFAQNGFYRDTTVSAEFIAHWAVVFTRAEPTPTDIVRRYEAVLWRAVDEAEKVRREILTLDRRLEEALGNSDVRQQTEVLERELLAAREQILSMRDEIIGLESRLAVSDGLVEFHVEEARRYEEFVKQYEAILASTSWRVIRGAMQPYDWLRRRLESEAE
jgi:2-polyprenyl-3-methyl-5-hydroxy-6-metoxy-1,4-benzoquinol methylase